MPKTRCDPEKVFHLKVKHPIMLTSFQLRRESTYRTVTALKAADICGLDSKVKVTSPILAG